MSRNYYVSGDWNVTCDVCSKKIKHSHARRRWDGFLVCPDDWEERHPQDFVKTRQDRIAVSETRPIPTLVYTSVCTQKTASCFADLCTADCARADATYGLSYAEVLVLGD